MPSNTSSRGSSSTGRKKPETATEQKMKRSPLFWVFSLVILVLIFISFVVAPALVGIGSPEGSLQFGTYGGEPITYEHNNYFYHQHQNIAAQFGQELTAENFEWQLYQIWRAAFNNTVVHMDLRQRAEAAGLQITDSRVHEFLRTSGPYINEQGDFDREIYSSTPASRRQEIQRQVRGDLLQQQVTSDLFSSKIPAEEAHFVFSLGLVEKRFDYVAFHLEEYPDDLTAAYAQEQQDLFRQIDISRISLRDNRSEAEAVRNRITEGEITFDEAARTYSIDIFAEDGGQAGWNYYYELRSDFQNEEELRELFSLSTGDISELVRTDIGYALYRVNTSPRQADLQDEDVLQAVRSYMTRSARGVIEDYFTEKAQAFSQQAREEGFTSLADEEGLTVHATGLFPLNYDGSMLLARLRDADPQGILSAASSNSFVLTELFAKSPGEITKPLITGNHVVVAVCREEVTGSADEIRQLAAIYPYYAHELQQNDFTQMVLDSDKLEDNFFSVFVTRILQAN